MQCNPELPISELRPKKSCLRLAIIMPASPFPLSKPIPPPNFSIQNALPSVELKSYCPIMQSPITAISWNKRLKCRTGKLAYCSRISDPAWPIHVISLPIPWTVWQLAKEKTNKNKASPRIILFTILQNSPISAIILISHCRRIWL